MEVRLRSKITFIVALIAATGCTIRPNPASSGATQLPGGSGTGTGSPVASAGVNNHSAPLVTNVTDLPGTITQIGPVPHELSGVLGSSYSEIISITAVIPTGLHYKSGNASLSVPVPTNIDTSGFNVGDTIKVSGPITPGGAVYPATAISK